MRCTLATRLSLAPVSACMSPGVGSPGAEASPSCACHASAVQLWGCPGWAASGHQLHGALHAARRGCRGVICGARLKWLRHGKMALRHTGNNHGMRARLTCRFSDPGGFTISVVIWTRSACVSHGRTSPCALVPEGAVLLAQTMPLSIPARACAE